jgi:hypothetical protein
MTALSLEKVKQMLPESRDVISDWLDFNKGHSISELDVFEKLARK